MNYRFNTLVVLCCLMQVLCLAQTSTNPTRCGIINDPVVESFTSVSGTLSGSVDSTLVTLYQDGTAIGSVYTAGTTWAIPVNTTLGNRLYAGAILAVGIKEKNKTETTCATTKPVLCSRPGFPDISPMDTTIVAGQTVTYQVYASQSGVIYTLRNSMDSEDVGESKFGNGGTITLTTYPFTASGVFTVLVKATSLSGASCSASTPANVEVAGTLPLGSISFSGKSNNNITHLNWETKTEQGLKYFEIQRSYNGRSFEKIGTVNAAGNTSLSRQYEYDDAAMASDIAYYRLKIVDNSTAGFIYSNTLIVKTNPMVSAGQVSPNPFESYVKLTFNDYSSGAVTVNITDLSGRKIKSVSLNSRQGDNSILIDGLGNLPAGSYVIELVKDNKKAFHQFLIKK